MGCTCVNTGVPTRSPNEAKDFIETWLSQAKALDNRHLTRFANTVESHIETILAWYEHPITSGPLEGLTDRIPSESMTAVSRNQ